MKFLLIFVLCTFVLDGVYAPPSSAYMKSAFVRNTWIKDYFRRGYSYGDISMFLAALHGITIGISGIKKVLKRMGLRRRVAQTEESMNIIIQSIREEIEGSGKSLRFFKPPLICVHLRN